MTLRVCSRCKHVKDDSEFYHRRNGQALSQCRNCHSKRIAARRKASIGGQNMHNAGQIYAAEWDDTPIPAPTATAYGILQDRILAVMSAAELDAWVQARC